MCLEYPDFLEGPAQPRRSQTADIAPRWQAWATAGGGLPARSPSGKLNASVLFVPSGSGAIVTVNGTPVFALKIPPNSQPLAAQPRTLGALGLGMSQV